MDRIQVAVLGKHRADLLHAVLVGVQNHDLDLPPLVITLKQVVDELLVVRRARIDDHQLAARRESGLFGASVQLTLILTGARVRAVVVDDHRGRVQPLGDRPQLFEQRRGAEQDPRLQRLQTDPPPRRHRR